MNTLDAPETPDTSARASRSLKAALALGVVGLAAVGYWFTGTPDYAAASVQAQRAAQADASAAAASAPAMPDAAQIDTMIGKLEAHLKTEPGDLQGWTMLGRAQTLLGRMEQASVAYARAVALRSDDARLLADYAEALGMSQGQSLQGEPSKLIARALAIDAMQPKALALAGAAAFDSKDYAAAARHWETLLGASSADAEYVAQLREGIGKARELGKLPAAPTVAAAPATPPPAQASRSASAAGQMAPTFQVSGMVTLAPALAAQARPDDTLFVFARAADGPRMPLLILRKQVRDLPLRFTLDQSMAMAGAAGLAGVKQLSVGARISRSGQAMPQGGDLAGQAAPVAVGAADVRVEINETVRAP